MIKDYLFGIGPGEFVRLLTKLAKRSHQLPSPQMDPFSLPLVRTRLNVGSLKTTDR